MEALGGFQGVESPNGATSRLGDAKAVIRSGRSSNDATPFTPRVARGDALRPVGYAQFEGTLAELPDAGVIVAVSPSQTGFRSARGVRFAFESDASEAAPATVKATLVNRSESSAVVDTADVPAFEPRPVYRTDEGGTLAFAPTSDQPFASRRSSPSRCTVTRHSGTRWLSPATHRSSGTAHRRSERPVRSGGPAKPCPSGTSARATRCGC